MTNAERKDEYDLVNEQDEVLRQGTYEDARREGLFTRSVHILLADPRGRFMLCKRAASKKTYPNLVTSSAGGHVEKGETFEQAAYRELKEELEVRVRLFDVGRFDVITEQERTIHHLFVGSLDTEAMRTSSTDPTEVASHAFVSLQKAASDALRRPKKYAPPFRQAIELLARPKTYIVDFDHTLFDWYGFKAELQKALEPQGVSEKIFTQAKDIHEERDGLYHVHKHLKEISAQTSLPYEILISIFEKVLRRSSRHIFPDAKKFLERIRRENGHAFLLTYGDKGNQELFIKGTGADRYFDEIVAVERKEQKLEEATRAAAVASGVSIIVNDDPREALHMAPSLSRTTRNYLVERPTAKFTQIEPNERYLVVKSLEEIF